MELLRHSGVNVQIFLNETFQIIPLNILRIHQSFSIYQILSKFGMEYNMFENIRIFISEKKNFNPHWV